MVKIRTLSKWVAISSIAVNGVIFAVKAIIALQIGSLSLLSDSVHTLSDSASSIAVYIGLVIAEKPADETHPFGHGRADQVAVLAVGLMLVLAALSFLSDGVQALFSSPEEIVMNTTLYIIIGLTAIAKEVMAEVSNFIGKKENSESLQADAWHHRGDAITTIVVIIALFGSSRGLNYLDPIVGIGIALLLGYVGFSYAKKAASKLLGRRPSRELIEEIRDCSLNYPDVVDVHNIKVHDYGGKKAISLHIKTKPGTKLKGHNITHELQDKLEKNFDAEVEVHFDPWEPPIEKIKSMIYSLISQEERIKDVHKIDVSETEDFIFISFHIIIPKKEEIGEAHNRLTEIENKIRDKIESELKVDVEVQVHMEPCDEDCEYCDIKCE